MLDAYQLEVLGKPTITICHDKFERAARSHASTLGLPDLPLLIEPAPKGSNVTLAGDAAALAARGVVRVMAALTAP